MQRQPVAVEVLRPEAVRSWRASSVRALARHSSAKRSSPVRACIARAASIVPGAPSSSSLDGCSTFAAIASASASAVAADGASRCATSRIPLDPRSSDAPAPSSSGDASAASWRPSATAAPSRVGDVQARLGEAPERVQHPGRADVEPAQDAVRRRARIVVAGVQRPQAVGSNAASASRQIAAIASRARGRPPVEIGERLVARRVVQRLHRARVYGGWSHSERLARLISLDGNGALHDEALLLSGDLEDFGLFYDRYVKALLTFFHRRTYDPEVAADLTAETFAAAMVARGRYQALSSTGAAWLFAIAQHKLADYRRRGSTEDRMRARLGMEPVPVSAEDADMIRWLAEEAAAQMVEELPPDQRDAIRAHVFEDRDYAEIARSQRLSEATVRKRVSRGLRVLRDRAGGSR